MSKYIRNGNVFRRVSDERAKKLVKNEKWIYSSKFDYKKLNCAVIEKDEEQK